MGANVAFSLYGSLKSHAFSGCSKDTFINSFYTNTGFNDFAKAMYYAGVSGFSQYSYNDDDSSSSSLSSKCMGGYGVGCDYSNGFAVHTYSTSECNPQNVTKVKDTLSNLNSAMNKATCVKIYDYSYYKGYTENTPLELLTKSHACFYQDVFSPDGECPDPYGMLTYYQTNFYNGIQESKKYDPYQVYQQRQVYLKQEQRGKTMARLGTIMLAIAGIVFVGDICVRMKRLTKRRHRKWDERRKARRGNGKRGRRSGDDDKDKESDLTSTIRLGHSVLEASEAAQRDVVQDSFPGSTIDGANNDRARGTSSKSRIF
jgi:hypothetical protein